MRLNLGLFGNYIPSWLDNEDQPKEEQLKVYYKRITGELASTLIRFSPDKSMIFDNVSIVRNCVTEIENLFDNDGEKVDTAEKLLATPGVSGLVTDIGNHILLDSQMIASEEKKNTTESALVQ